MLTDFLGKKHPVYAIGRVFHDEEEIRLKVEEMYPFVDKILIAEGRTHDTSYHTGDHVLDYGIPDPANKIEWLRKPGPWNNNLESMQQLWAKVPVNAIVHIFGADEYLSKRSWDRVMREFYLAATRVNLPLFDLWHDFSWRSTKPFPFHIRFVLKQPGTAFENHFKIVPERVVNRSMRHMHEICPDLSVAIYHTCWTKPPEHLIKRSLMYLRRDNKLMTPGDLLKLDYPGTHVYLGAYLRGDTAGFSKFDKSELPEVLAKHSKYNYEWDKKSIPKEVIDKALSEMPDIPNPRAKIKKIPHVEVPGKPRILYITYDNTANIPWLVTETFKKMGHESHLLQGKDTWIGYPRGQMVAWGNVQEVLKWVKWADIILWNEWFIYGTYQDVPIMPHIVGKRVIRIGHGTYIRENHGVLSTQIQKYKCASLVTTPDLLQLMPGSIWWTAPVGVYGITPNKISAPSITHAPTNREIKDSDLFEDAIKDLPIQYLQITKMKHPECLKMIAQGWYHYDQMKLLAYGVSAVEGGLLDSVVLVNYDSYPNKHEIPFISVNPYTLKTKIQEVIKWDRAQINIQLKNQHDYIDRYHNPEKQCQKLLDIASATEAWQWNEK